MLLGPGFEFQALGLGVWKWRLEFKVCRLTAGGGCMCIPLMHEKYSPDDQLPTTWASEAIPQVSSVYFGG